MSTLCTTAQILRTFGVFPCHSDPVSPDTALCHSEFSVPRGDPLSFGPLQWTPTSAMRSRMVELKKAKLDEILKVRDVRTLSEEDIVWLIKEFNACLEDHAELTGKYRALVTDEINRLQRERDFEEGCG